MSPNSIGVGLRSTHYPFLENRPKIEIEWFEAISENYIDSEGRPLKMLELIRKDYPVALHGVSLSIGTDAELDQTYLKKWKQLIDRIEPFIVSDHLCWTKHKQHNSHDLLPLPYTEEAITVISNKIEKVQNYIQRELTIENVSTYMTFEQSEMEEYEFINRICKKSGCKVLLDINNIYVSSKNHNFSAQDFIDQIHWKNVQQIHLAGHTDLGDILFDTHSKAVCDGVWKLLRYAHQKYKFEAPILLEWDDDIPEFKELEKEALKAKKWIGKTLVTPSLKSK